MGQGPRRNSAKGALALVEIPGVGVALEFQLLVCLLLCQPTQAKNNHPPLEQHATKELVLSRSLCVSGAFFSANKLLGLGAFPAWQSRKQNVCPVLFKSCDVVNVLTSEIKYVQSKELSGKTCVNQQTISGKQTHFL